MKSPLRSLISALSAVVLVMGLLGTECPACATQVALSGFRPCCDQAGNCKDAAENSIPARCLKGQAGNVAVLQQPVQPAPMLAGVVSDPPRSTFSALDECQVTHAGQFSPPHLYLLNSNLLL